MSLYRMRVYVSASLAVLIVIPQRFNRYSPQCFLFRNIRADSPVVILGVGRHFDALRVLYVSVVGRYIRQQIQTSFFEALGDMCRQSMSMVEQAGRSFWAPVRDCCEDTHSGGRPIKLSLAKASYMPQTYHVRCLHRHHSFIIAVSAHPPEYY